MKGKVSFFLTLCYRFVESKQLSHKIYTLMSFTAISLNSFSTWLVVPQLAQQLSNSILHSWPLVDGYEIQLCWSDLEAFTSSVERGEKCLPSKYHNFSKAAQKHILNLPFISFHLDSFAALNGEEIKKISRSLALLSAHLPHAYFVAHPDEVNEDFFRNVTDELEEPRILTVENMDFRKKTHHRLCEVASLLSSNPKLGLTFDVCHWLENEEQNSTEELIHFISQYKDRVRAIHVSSPVSLYVGYHISERTNHYLCSESGNNLNSFMQTILALLHSDVALVLEGFAPPSCSSLITQEILQIELWSRAAGKGLSIQGTGDSSLA